MPTNPTYPGVYIEEIPSGVQTITGVATSIGAFFGRTAKGPLNKAVRCFNYSDFTRVFGGAHPSSDLAQSLRQFFNNGGTDCYVIRLAHGAEKASLTLKAIDKSTNVLTAAAKNAGNWGNGIHLEVDYNTDFPDETFNLKVISEDNGVEVANEPYIELTMDPNSPRYAPTFVTQSSSIIDLASIPATSTIDGYSESRRPFDISNAVDASSNSILLTELNDILSASGHFKMSLNGDQFVSIDLSELIISIISGEDHAESARNAIQNEINNQLSATFFGEGITNGAIICNWELVHDNFRVLRITSNYEPNNKSYVKIQSVSATDLAKPMMLGVNNGGIEVARYSDLRPVPTATVLTGDINDVAALAQNAFNQLQINGAAHTVDFATSLVTTGDADKWYTENLPSSVNDNNDGVIKRFEFIRDQVNTAPGLPCRAELWGYHLAFIQTDGTINDVISIATGDDGGGGTNIGEGATADLFTKNVLQYALGTTGTSDFQDGPGTMGKDDDSNPLDTNDYVGNEIHQTGFHALDPVDIFNLMILPDDDDVDFTDIWGAASRYCEKHRAFLLIDAPKDWTDEITKLADVVQNTDKVNDLRSSVTNISSAVFYPRLKYKDNGLAKWINPGGAIAGLFARTDAARGVWKAPAGTEADIRGILGLEVKLTDSENGVLNKLAVNCLREFPGSFVCWGSRTMDGHDRNPNADWKYIPVRRLTLFLEESLYRGTQWVVFEPNDEPLWAKIRLNVGAFMKRLFRQGAFQGSTPDKAFYVKCDAETTPQADINLGIVNIEVGFAPLKPAEFVIIKIQQMIGEL
jgi:Bacteriophage tail sheath protein